MRRGGQVRRAHGRSSRVGPRRRLRALTVAPAFHVARIRIHARPRNRAGGAAAPRSLAHRCIRRSDRRVGSATRRTTAIATTAQEPRCRSGRHPAYRGLVSFGRCLGRHDTPTSPRCQPHHPVRSFGKRRARCARGDRIVQCRSWTPLGQEDDTVRTTAEAVDRTATALVTTQGEG